MGPNNCRKRTRGATIFRSFLRGMRCSSGRRTSHSSLLSSHAPTRGGQVTSPCFDLASTSTPSLRLRFGWTLTSTTSHPLPQLQLDLTSMSTTALTCIFIIYLNWQGGNRQEGCIEEDSMFERIFLLNNVAYTQ